MSFIDLHIHTVYSNDGEYEPVEIADLCLQKGIRYFSIADHNSIKAIDEAMSYCKDKDIKMLPAVELDCTFEGIDLHVLGYGIDYHSPVFDEIEEDILRQEQIASQKRIKLVREAGIDFSEEVIAALSRNGVVTGEMIAEAAMKFDEKHNNKLLKPYYEHGSRSDNPYVNFYWDFCAQGKPAYAEVKFISLQQAVGVIKGSGGIPVLAHPGNNIKDDLSKLEAIISCGVAGIEAYSSYHNEKQVALYKEYAKANKLLITCGSDFHGKTKPRVSLGCSECEEEDIADFLELTVFNKVGI